MKNNFYELSLSKDGKNIPLKIHLRNKTWCVDEQFVVDKFNEESSKKILQIPKSRNFNKFCLGVQKTLDRKIVDILS